MANTALLQAVVRTLMEGRNASPLSPVPAAPMIPPGGPLLLPPGPAPEPAPVAPMPAQDTALIEQLTGPRPVAPTPQPDSLLQKISRALIGFGAGTQGFGPQYLAGLREERERPQREFRAATEQYEQRRAGAIEFDERRRERQQAATQAQADAASEREFRQWVQRTGVQDALALEQLRQTFELNKLREAERIADERLLKQQRLVFNKELGAQIKFYRANGIKDPMQARRLALNDFSDFATELGIPVPALTKADTGMLAKVEAYVSRLARIGRGGASGAGSGGTVNAKAEAAKQQFESVKQQVIDAEERGDTAGAEQLRRKMISIHTSLASRFPGVFELGYGDREGKWPYVVPRQGAQPQAAPSPSGGRGAGFRAEDFGISPIRDQMNFDLRGGSQPQAQASEAEVQEYMRMFNVTAEVARRELAEIRR